MSVKLNVENISGIMSRWINRARKIYVWRGYPFQFRVIRKNWEICHHETKRGEKRAFFVEFQLVYVGVFTHLVV